MADNFDNDTFDATGEFRWAMYPGGYDKAMLVSPEGEPIMWLGEAEDRTTDRDLSGLPEKLTALFKKRD